MQNCSQITMRMDSSKVDEFIREVSIAIGKKIKDEREKRKLSLADTEALSNIDSGDFSRYEHGNGNPTLKTLIKMAIATKLDSFEIFGLEFPLEQFIED